MNKKISAFQICMIAMAVCINVAGGQLALALHLPVYLDSIGTILTGALLGPLAGMLPNLLSGLIMGLTTDIYSLYFAPVGMVTGVMSGLVFKKGLVKKAWIFPAALAVTVPGTILSSLICAGLFGGITSSGSVFLVQLLEKATPLNMTASVFAVQIVTDYLDRLVSLLAVIYVLKKLPQDMKNKWTGGWKRGCSGRTLQ